MPVVEPEPEVEPPVLVVDDVEPLEPVELELAPVVVDAADDVVVDDVEPPLAAVPVVDPELELLSDFDDEHPTNAASTSATYHSRMQPPTEGADNTTPINSLRRGVCFSWWLSGMGRRNVCSTIIMEKSAVFPSFTAQICCPLCSFTSLASAPTYLEAQQCVSSALMQHLDKSHAEPADNDHVCVATPAAV